MAELKKQRLLPGAPPGLRADIEERSAEFERQHEQSVLADGRLHHVELRLDRLRRVPVRRERHQVPRGLRRAHTANPPPSGQVAGFNPVALIATAAGALFYLWTLNPLTWTSANGLFPYITAGLPSYAVAFVTYALLMRLWILPTRGDELVAAHPVPAGDDDRLAAT